MYLFDLHCDTVTECLDKGKSIVQSDLQLDLVRGITSFENWIQVFAFWLDTSYSGESAFERFLKQREFFLNTVVKNSVSIELYKSGGEIKKKKCNALISVEGGHVLGGRLDRIPLLKKYGVSFLTLVWNCDNEIGSGILGSGRGLTGFGRECVTELEKNNIIIDISHLNHKGTDDLFAIAKRPVVATHSNSYAVHKHDRNLDDQQLLYLIEHDGLCGMNFYPMFVNGGTDYQLGDLHRHLDRVLLLGGEDIIAIGSDFDGAPMPSCINGVEKLYKLYDEVVKWYGEKITKKMFYNNAKDFIHRNIVIL